MQNNIQKLQKNTTISILGTSKENDYTKPYLTLAKKLSYALAQKGFNIITGGAKGINYCANCGASSFNSQNSWVIDADIVGIDFEQITSQGQKLYNILKKTNTGCERSSLMCNLCKAIICFPGGMGTLEEIGVVLEHMYYNINSPCEKIFLIGDFYLPIMKLIENMTNNNLVDKSIVHKVIYMPLKSDENIDSDNFTDKIIKFLI